MLVPRPRLRDALPALCAELVPSGEGRVTDPRAVIFLPWKNGLFYDDCGVRVTDSAMAGNYGLRGLISWSGAPLRPGMTRYGA